MKRLITITVFCISFFMHNIYAQNYNKDGQLTQEAIRKTAEFYVLQNIDFPYPEDLKQDIINDALSEGMDMKNIDNLILHYKKQYLTSKFYENNPKLKEAFNPPANKGPIGCISEDFEGAVIGFTYKTGKTDKECAENTISYAPATIDFTPNSPPDYDVNFAIVSSGNDELVAAAINGTFFLDKVKSGNRSIKINQDLHEPNPPSGEDHYYDYNEVDVLKRTFKIDANELTFDFATVIEDAEAFGSHTDKLPYLKWILKKGNQIIGEDCYTAYDSDLTSTPFQIQLPTGQGAPGTFDIQDWVFSEWETVSIDVSNYIDDIVTLSIEVADCEKKGHGAYAYIDNIENCEPEVIDCCDLQPGINYTSDYCDLSFTGTNTGTTCPGQLYSWTVDGVTVGTQETLNYTFPETGAYEVCYRICSTNSKRGLDKGIECCESYCEVVNVVCERICQGPQGCIHIDVENDNEGFNCTGAQATLSCSPPDVNYVEWYWALGTVTDIICSPDIYCQLPTDYSAPFAAFSTNWSGAYAGYNIYFKAIVHYNDGTECEFLDWVTLECDGPGSGGGLGIQLHPNPLKSGNNISFEGISFNEVNDIEIYDIYGNQKLTMKPTKQSFNVEGLTNGIYMVRFNKSDGKVIQKKLIVE